MFTGIVQTTGRVKRIEGSRHVIGVANFLGGVKIGDSIAVNGVCATITHAENDEFTIEIMPETARVTTFGHLRTGDEVNLEKSLRVGGRLDGHFVMGHADGVGEIKEIKKIGKFIEIIIAAPQELRKYIARKGSIAVNGVSLTIAEDFGDSFKVSLITHTKEVTNFRNVQVGDKVNLEIDMVARYLEKFVKCQIC